MAYKRLLSDVYYKSKFTGKEIDRRLTDVDDKQDIITDLDEIRAGAAKGETAYQLPEGGIPDTDLSQGVNASLNKADTAVQDPNYVHTDNNYTNADKTKLGELPAASELDTALNDKVDKVEGKGLSTNDYTDAEKTKLTALPTNDELTTALAGKQDVISDIDTIRSGAGKGATAIQGVKVNGTALTPDANKVVDIEGVEVASAVTESFLSRTSRGKVQATISQLQGDSKIWNQQIPTASTSGTATIGSNGFIAVHNITGVVATHNYYFCITVKNNGSNPMGIIVYFGDTSTYIQSQSIPSGGTFRFVGTKVAVSGTLYQVRATGTNGDTLAYSDLQLIDLTQYYNGSVPAEIPIADIEAMATRMGNAYNAGQIVNVAPTAITVADADDETEQVTPLPITTMTSGGTAVYPLGLAKVGSLTDILKADADGWIRKARVQFGSRAYQAGDESDPTVLTDGTTTIYPLTTPQEQTLDTPICLNYPQLGGTEWALGTTLPLPATTLYDAPIGKASKADLATALDGKVDKVVGKGLSTNDYTDADKTDVAKIDGIEAVIPSAATPSNQLADKAFVASNYAQQSYVEPAFEDVALTYRRTRNGALSKGTGMAAIRRIKGNTVVFNQLNEVQNNLQDVAGTTTNMGNTASSKTYYANHTYLFAATITTLTAKDRILLWGGQRTYTVGIKTKSLWTAIITPTSDTTRTTCFTVTANYDGGTESGKAGYENLIVVDLTQEFGPGNEPTTVEAFKAMFPLSYYAYDAGSILNVQSTGVMTTGQNLWDEEWELGYYLVTNGTKASSTNRIRCKNLIPVIPNQTYCIKARRTAGGNDLGELLMYDENKQYISTITPTTQGETYTTFDVPANCAYITFYFNPYYGAVYNYDICINISNPAINGTYQPYRGFTSLLPITTITGKKDGLGASDTPFANGLNGLRGVFDTIDARGGIKRFARVDLGSLSWETNTYAASGRIYVNLPVKAQGVANIVYPLGFTATSDSSELIDKAGICGNASSGYIYIGQGPVHTDSAAFITSLSGVYAIFELATPEHWVWDSPMHPFYPYDNTGTEAEVPQGTASTPQLPLPIEVDYEPNGVSFQAHQLEILQGQ